MKVCGGASEYEGWGRGRVCNYRKLEQGLVRLPKHSP